MITLFEIFKSFDDLENYGLDGADKLVLNDDEKKDEKKKKHHDK